MKKVPSQKTDAEEMIKEILEEQADLSEYVKICRRHYRVRGASWRLPDLSCPPTFFSASAWPLWAMCKYAAGVDVGTLHSGGGLFDEWRRLLRGHLLSCFPSVPPATILEEEVRLGRLFHTAAIAATSAHELGTPAHVFVDELEEQVRGIAEGLEKMVSPLLRTRMGSDNKSVFFKEKQKVLLATVVGRHRFRASASSSSSSSEDDDLDIDESEPKRARVEVKPRGKLNRHHRRKALIQKKGLEAFARTTSPLPVSTAPSSVPSVVQETPVSAPDPRPSRQPKKQVMAKAKVPVPTKSTKKPVSTKQTKRRK